MIMVGGQRTGGTAEERDTRTHTESEMQDALTELEAVVAELRLSEAKYARLFHSLPAGVIVARRDDGEYIDVNEAFVSLFGYSREELIGHSAVDLGLFSPETRALILRHLKEGRVENFEISITCKSGEIKTCLFSADVFDLAGVPHIQISTIDITGRKEAERTRAFLSALVESSADAIIGRDVDGTILSWNAGAQKLFGYSAEEAIGQHVAMLVAPAGREMMQQALNDVAKGHDATGVERRLRTKDGRGIEVAMTSFLVRDAQGQVIGASSIARDISERKRIEEALRQLNATLEERVQERTAELAESNATLAHALRVKDEFLSTMSHELRTPLTGVLGMADALQEQVYGPLNERQVKCMSTIERSGRHLLALINDVLDLSRVDSSRMELNPTELSVYTVCEHSIQMVREMALHKHQALRLEVSPSAMQMVGDYRRIQQILVNLLGNAVKFTPEEGRIELDAEGDAGTRTITFSVRDTGIGIADADQPRLFQPFVQLDSGLAREYTGTGLGLALVRSLAEAHGGTAGVESVLGKGSRFYVTLPWETLAPTGEPAVVDGGARPRVATTTPASILVADDDATNVEVVADYLDAHGYSVTTAEDGEAALRMCETVRPDVVLMDIHMPGMDGLEAMRRIRAHADSGVAATRIIALTALAMANDRERCLAAGANDYLSKPMALTALVRAIEAQLQPSVASSG